MNITELFNEYGIRYWGPGAKNVSYGWIGISCIFCGDTSNHLGINLKTHRCRCWICGSHKFTKVLQGVLEIPYAEAVRYAKEIDPSEIGEDDGSISYNAGMSIKLPSECVKRFPKLHYDYLRNRGFPVLRTIREYRLRAVEHLGPYKFRIIIPVIYKGRIVTFTSRDVTTVGEPKYKAANKKQYPNIKSYVYGLDSVSHAASSVVLVEGPTDVWRLGAGAISLFGIQAHGKQFLHLASKEIKTLHILFDNDEPGYRAAGVVAKQIRSLVQEVNIVSLQEVADPGLLSREQGEIIMRTLGVRK